MFDSVLVAEKNMKETELGLNSPRLFSANYDVSDDFPSAQLVLEFEEAFGGKVQCESSVLNIFRMPSVSDMMKKAVTESNDFYASTTTVAAHDTLKEARRKQRKEQKATLTQWYGMKKITMTDDVRQEVELLKYRNFLNKDTAHRAPKVSNGPASEFMEFGYFADVGKNKRKQCKSFADEWLAENPELEEVVAHRVKKNIRLGRKAKLEKERQAKKAALRSSKGKRGAKRKRLGDKDGTGGLFDD
jgi:hypothetical protein